MALRRIISSPDAKEAALSFILGGNANKVVWNDCQFIWDSRGLLADAASDDEVSDRTIRHLRCPSSLFLTATTMQVAIFGAKGKVVTPQNELLQFHIRHCLDLEPQPTYRLHVAVEEQPGGSVGETNLRNQDIASGDDQAYFRRRVLDLTEQVKALGLGETMRSFLTRSDVDGFQAHQERVSNGVKTAATL